MLEKRYGHWSLRVRMDLRGTPTHKSGKFWSCQRVGCSGETSHQLSITHEVQLTARGGHVYSRVVFKYVLLILVMLARGMCDSPPMRFNSQHVEDTCTQLGRIQIRASHVGHVSAWDV
jgi:hypothetical protein